MLGVTLYPLNELRSINADIYNEALKKYAGREKLLQDKVPFLDCLWSDVVHLSPVHPTRVVEAYQELGYKLTSICYQIDAGTLDANKTVIYWYKYLDFRDRQKPDNFERFSVDKLTSISELPQVTKKYYQSMFEKGERPLQYVGVPHILYKGSINIFKAPIVTGSQPVTSWKSRQLNRRENPD